MPLGSVGNNEQQIVSVESKTPYSDPYKESAFLAWYNAGRPTGSKLSLILPVDEWGRRPHYREFLKWKRNSGWDDRADKLDLEVQGRMEESAIEQRMSMFKRHAEIGAELIEMGMAYLEEHDLQKSADAIKAIIEGVRIEADSRGGKEALLKIIQMSDSELEKLIYDNIRRGGDIVDGTISDVPVEE